MGSRRRTTDFSRPTTVFVTGGTGYIGTRLVNALLAKGHSIRCLTRSTSNRAGLDDPRVTLVPGNLMDPESLKAGMEGCTQVYHLAAFAKPWSKDPNEVYRQNIDGMNNVFDAAESAGVRRIVYTSTIVTLGPSRFGEVRDESEPRITKKYFSEYEESKAIAEQQAVERAKNGLPVVIVNPTRVYGPGKMTEGNSTTIMIDMYDRGRLPVLLNDGINIGNYVFVEDLVRGFILAMERGKIGERYILGGENSSLKGFYRIIDEVSGKSHIQFPLPPALGMVYGWLEKQKGEVFGLRPQITPKWVDTFLQDWAYSCAKAERELGYTITPLKEGIRLTYEWLLEQRGRKG